MGRVQRHIRGIAALCLAVHVVAGLLATFAHDHRSAAGCCGGRANAVAGADGGGHGPLDPIPGRQSCRHRECGHSPTTQQGRGSPRFDASGPGLAVGAGTDLQARCLACEFLARAIAILPWAPAVGPAAERWDDPAAARQMPRAAVIAASFPRGPPA